MLNLTRIILFFLIACSNCLFGQVTLSPSNVTSEVSITITFDATGTPLATETNIYAHAGVVTNNTPTPTGSDWANVKGNWGKDDGIGKMTAILGEPGKWKLELSPTLRQYFEVPAGTPIFWLALVFRNANGSKQTSPDIYVKLALSNYVSIVTPDPSGNQIFVEQGQNISITTEASPVANTIELFVDAGVGFQPVGSISNASQLQVNYLPLNAGILKIKSVATFPNASAEAIANYSVLFRGATISQNLPLGIGDGINYFSNDPTKAVLVLVAPGKEFVYLVGDFNDWLLDDNFLMKRTPDGERFWIEINGLQPIIEYVFQYWVEGTIKVGDPLSDKVSDPNNDSSIPASTYPNLPVNTRTENGIASVLQTGQTSFIWSANEASYVPPAKDELLIYELLLRDFVGSRRYKDLTDSLNYFKRLGINTIELMPIMEFEGNLSWGYNPSYFLAPDKMYGTKNDLKTFIDKAHQKGIAVVLDIALNHAFGQNAMVKMYWDKANNKPALNNPWFNSDATHPFNVGYDFNHESPYTQAFVDTVTSYWLKEYHVDGFRFDLSKGFTQKKSGDNVGAWSNYDASRIDILDRMASQLFKTHPKAIIILEHFADEAEEANLASKGMILWRNLNFDFSEVMKGNTGQSFGNALAKTHVSYMESHDEERVPFEMLVNGNSSSTYNIKEEGTYLDRMKMAAAFLYTLPGSKMLWQFQELAYDKSINTCSNGSINDNCRLDNKPLVWGTGSLNYYTNSQRQSLFDTYAAINSLVNTNKATFKNGSTSWKSSGATRTINIQHTTMDVVIVANFSTTTASVQPGFSKAGTWFDYFSGEAITITDPNGLLPLTPGEFHIYTTAKQPTPKAGLVTEIKDLTSNRLTIYPNPAREKLYLSIGDNYYGHVHILFNDMLGREIEKKSIHYQGQAVELDVTKLENGFYLVKVENGSGHDEITKLLIHD